MRPLPDPAKSRAVVIGVDSYSVLPELPSVTNNVNDLAALLSDPELWGLRGPDHCRVLLNPQSPATVLDAVHDAAAEAEDAIVVYFAGHGLVSPNGDLYLALPESHAGRLHWAVPYEALRHQLIDVSTATSKVVILDCCYSGRALVGHMGAPVEMADHAVVEGTYLMTASAETKLAWAPAKERHTAFTGELLRAMDHGIPQGSDLLEMETLFWHVRRELEAKARPLPQQRARNAGHNIALVRNRAASEPENQKQTEQPEQPEQPKQPEQPARTIARAGGRSVYRRRWLGAAAAAVLLAATPLVVQLLGDDGDEPTQGKSTSGSSTTAEPSAGSGQSTATPRTASTAVKAAKGYVHVQEPEFGIQVPAGWQRHAKNGDGQYTYTKGDDYTLIVVPGRDTTAMGSDDPVTYQNDVEAELAVYRDSEWSTATGRRRIDIGDRAMAEGNFTWQTADGREIYAENLVLLIGDRYHVVLTMGPEDTRDVVSRVQDQAGVTYAAKAADR
ncbi:caspase family protein [Streptomyces sp. NPDC002143]